MNGVSNGGIVIQEQAQILDACCGGRFWWWNKEHPLAVYMDQRIDLEPPEGCNPNWKCEPTVVGDFREMPFGDECFQLVLFDPPHIVRPNPSGRIPKMYGALLPDTEQEDLKLGFSECWRVLAPGGTLVVKWAGDLGRVAPHFPADPIVGTRTIRRNDGLGTRWFIFYKALA